MDFNKKRQAILFLDRNRFDFYEAMGGRILVFPFNNSIISSIEVIDSVAFETQIQTFVEQNNIAPLKFVVILSSDILFEKDIASDQEVGQQESQIQTFLDSVPFDSLITKITPYGNAVRISTTNKALCDVIKSAFEKKRFSLDAFVPYEALGQDFYQIRALDNQNAPAIFKMYESLKSNSFLLQDVEENPQPEAGKNETTKQTTNKPRLYAMIGVFSILAIILIVVLLTQIQNCPLDKGQIFCFDN